MDYERIQKPQGGGGFSPGKLRSTLLGVEKKRKQEEELDSSLASRSQQSDMDESGGSGSDQCKDVDVVSVHPEYSSSTDPTCSVEADSGDRMTKAILLRRHNMVMEQRTRRLILNTKPIKGISIMDILLRITISTMFSIIATMMIITRVYLASSKDALQRSVAVVF